MAVVFYKRADELGPSAILSPERYDPRRRSLAENDDDSAGVLLRDVVTLARESVVPARASGRRFLVFDTSDAREGVLTCRKEPVSGPELGSQKKVARPGDVVVSRLRPYLRQVALIDTELAADHPGIELAISTEYYILRSPDERSIAFLVPYLLSDKVQSILAASVEGGHHPRFDSDALLHLVMPHAVLGAREALSKAVEDALRAFRSFEKGMRAAVTEVEAG